LLQSSLSKHYNKAMKTIVLVTAMILTFNFVSAQDKRDTLNIIEKKVMLLDKDTNYWTSTYKNEAFLDTGFINQPSQGYGLLTGYFKNGKICIIRELVGLKLMNEVAVTDYYFSDGKLIYVYEREKQGPDIFIGSDGTTDYRIKEPNFEVKYYFSNDKLFATTEKGIRKTMLLPNAEFFDSQSKEGQLLLTAQKYHALFSIKYKQ
jgi:hypothetical protein